MEKEQALHAILTPKQLENFCEEFGLSMQDIEPDFSGWTKHVILSPDHVFLFPRHIQFDDWLEKELMAYLVFTRFSNIPAPKLIRVVDDPKLSYYRFGVVTRMEGAAFSTIEPGIGVNEYKLLLGELGRLTATCHEIPLDVIPGIIGPKTPNTIGEHTELERWMLMTLSQDTMDQALTSLFSLIVQLIEVIDANEFRSLLTEDNMSKWRNVFEELASLKPVLIHGDIHEDQILIHSRENMEISGILDWGTAAIANPVFDFNFGEWGLNIWRFRSHFKELRSVMWQEYLKARKLSMSIPDGLHIFFTLNELYRVVSSGKPILENEGLTCEDEIQNILATLKEATDFL